MRISISLLILLLITSCKKEATKPITGNDTVIAAVPLKKTNATNGATIDTAFFSFDSKSRQKEYVLVHTLQKKYDNDSICKAQFRLDFIQNRKRMYSHNIEINGFDEGSAWYANYEVDSLASPLKSVTVGYEACGYMQHNYLFYVTDKKGDLIHQWKSMSDSGWGSWGEIISGTPQNFYFHMESFSPEDDNEDTGSNEFSDSTHFELKNEKWLKTVLTPEGKTYRKKKLSFNDFHKS